jgi:pyruvate dehydrogenase E1 component alpha subunit
MACYTYRIETHFMGDIDIRPEEEVDEWRKKDPINDLETRMVKSEIISGAYIEETKEKIHQQVEAAIDFARKSPTPKPEAALEHVYAKYP